MHLTPAVHGNGHPGEDHDQRENADDDRSDLAAVDCAQARQDGVGETAARGSGSQRYVRAEAETGRCLAGSGGSAPVAAIGAREVLPALVPFEPSVAAVGVYVGASVPFGKAAVGVSVGVLVGVSAAVGLIVGTAVGVSVGVLVGASVVGVAVGLLVGTAVGADVLHQKPHRTQSPSIPKCPKLQCQTKHRSENDNNSAVQCGAVRCSAVQCGAVRCGAVQCSTKRQRRRQSVGRTGCTRSPTA